MSSQTDPRLLLLSPRDNVFVLRGAIDGGETVVVAGTEVQFSRRLGLGHKIAARFIAAGEKVIKYGAPIGSAVCDIAPGAHVHLHNLASDYTPTHSLAGSRTDHDAATGNKA